MVSVEVVLPFHVPFVISSVHLVRQYMTWEGNLLICVACFCGESHGLSVFAILPYNAGQYGAGACMMLVNEEMGAGFFAWIVRAL